MISWFSVGLQSFPIKIWGKSVQGFLSYDRTTKQTNEHPNRDYNFIFLDVWALATQNMYYKMYIYLNLNIIKNIHDNKKILNLNICHNEND